MNRMTEQQIENWAIDLLEHEHNYSYFHGKETILEGQRESSNDVLLESVLNSKVHQLNRSVPAKCIDEALTKLIKINESDTISKNKLFHSYLVDGIKINYTENGETRGTIINLIDFDNPNNNDFRVVNQFSIAQKEYTKRPDIILFVNGLPLVVIELKNPASETADIVSAFDQFETYKATISNLFTYNAFLIISDGLEARAGTVTSDFSRFMTWKTADGKTEESPTIGQLQTLIKGMLNKEVLLELIKHFIVFQDITVTDEVTKEKFIKKTKILAGYHQFYAVKKAVVSTLQAAGIDKQIKGYDDIPKGRFRDRKGGVIWHTQGSGKSLSMVFFCGKIIQNMDNPTIVVITDRNDLDDQLFGTFGSSVPLLKQEPVQATSRKDLKTLLNRQSGGIIFTTIHKFHPDEGLVHELLTNRENVVVITDEAHRTQYGFKIKTITKKDAQGNVLSESQSYGFAKYLRDALPNATYLGFTGTPVETENANTELVFGSYIDTYDIARAVNDGATVPIYYQSRLAKISLSEKGKEMIKQLDEELSENEEDEAEKAKSKWSQIEALVGSKDRVKHIARDILNHFEQRRKTNFGKGMIVSMSRRIAADLYDEIISLRPDWHSDDLNSGKIKVVITNASSDKGKNIALHHTTKEERRTLANRLKNPDDELELVIVRDMWLTGFDAPCLNTLYIDKPMKGHNLMQAIARVNRVYKDKIGGLVVDYLGVYSDMRNALQFYSRSGGQGDPTTIQDEALSILNEKIECLEHLLHGFDFSRYFTTQNVGEKINVTLETEDFILSLENGKKRFVDLVAAMSKAYSIASSHDEAIKLSPKVEFFQTVKARLVKFSSRNNASGTDYNTAIKQIVDQAIVSERIVDVYEESGIENPDISILNDSFIEELKDMKHKNLAVEVLKKLLEDEIKGTMSINMIQSESMQDKLDKSLKKYYNRIISSTEVLEELIKHCKEIKAMKKNHEELGLEPYEYAFYCAVANNDSAKELMSQDILKELAAALFIQVKKNATIDWTIKEDVRAKMRVAIKRLLKKYGYPPKMEKFAITDVIKQAEMMADRLNKN